jgi:SAM-dependent methyltransferase
MKVIPWRRFFAVLMSLILVMWEKKSLLSTIDQLTMTHDFNFLDRLIRDLRLKKVKKYLKSNANICDFGCGDGVVLKDLDKIFHFNYGVGIDSDIDLPDNTNNLKFIKTDIVRADVQRNFFDFVLMLAVAEHLENDQLILILAEIKKILKNGGLLIITTPSPWSKPVLEFLAFKLNIISRKEVLDHKHYYYIGELSKLLEQAGFKKIEAKYFQCHFNALYIFKK